MPKIPKKTTKKDAAPKAAKTEVESPKPIAVADLNLDELKVAVDQIESLESLSTLMDQEETGQDRIGAYQIFEDRKQVLNNSTEVEPDPSSENTPEAQGIQDLINSVDTSEGPVKPTQEQVDAEDEIKAKKDAIAKQQDEALDRAITITKKWRLKIDELMQFQESHMALNVDQQVQDTLFKGKAWMGIMLHELGTTNPYKTEKPLTEAKDIPPTAEKNDGTDFHIKRRQFTLKNNVEALVQLRTDLEDVIDPMERVQADVSREFSIARTQAVINLREAKFYFGRTLASKRK